MCGDSLDATRKAEVYSEALEILGSVLTWHMLRQRWTHAGQAVDALAVAVAADDLPAIVRAIADLELLGPVRLIRIGESDEDKPQTPPEPVRDRVNRLIHELRQVSQQGSAAG